MECFIFLYPWRWLCFLTRTEMENGDWQAAHVLSIEFQYPQAFASPTEQLHRWKADKDQSILGRPLVALCGSISRPLENTAPRQCYLSKFLTSARIIMLGQIIHPQAAKIIIIIILLLLLVFCVYRVCVYMFKWMLVSTQASGGQRRVLDILFYCYSCLLRQGLSLNRKLDVLAIWLASKLPGSVWLCPQC